MPYADTEVTGVYGLKFFADMAHVPISGTATNPMDSRKLTIYGGKGGVGKTTSASSWAVRLASSGLRTLVISTDPAHSLGDALEQPLTGVPTVVGMGAPFLTDAGGELWAMEVDPDKALVEFRETLRDAMQVTDGGGSGGMLGGMGLPDLKKEIMSMLDAEGIADAPGTDEVVALAKVISYLEDGYELPDPDQSGNKKRVKFDRVVLDTAPTGHTL